MICTNKETVDEIVIKEVPNNCECNTDVLIY